MRELQSEIKQSTNHAVSFYIWYISCFFFQLEKGFSALARLPHGIWELLKFGTNYNWFLTSQWV